MAISGFELRQVTGNALVDAFETAHHLAFGESVVARVEGFELRAIDGDTRFAEQIELAPQDNERAAELGVGPALVLAEIGDRLEVRCEAAGQPDQLDVALTLAFEAAARRNAVEIAIDVYLEYG
jgi:hypothetical protein